MVNNPKGKCTPEKNNTIDIPNMISGKTIGRYVIIWMYFLPLKEYHLTAIAANVAIAVDTIPAVNAINKLLYRAFKRSLLSSNNNLYHFKEK
jgi:hypothetical protein